MQATNNSTLDKSLPGGATGGIPKTFSQGKGTWTLQRPGNPIIV